MQVRLGRPNVEHLERSECRIACGLSADHTDLSLAGMAAPCEVHRQPAGYSARETMVPSQDTNEEEWMVLPADHSLAGWTAPSEVQEKHTGKAGKVCTFHLCGMFTAQDCV